MVPGGVKMQRKIAQMVFVVMIALTKVGCAWNVVGGIVNLLAR